MALWWAVFLLSPVVRLMYERSFCRITAMCLLNSSLAVLRAEGNILGCTRGWLCNFNGWSYGTELFFFFKAVCFLISNPIYYFQTHTENHEYVQSEAIQSALAVVALYPVGAQWGKLSAAGVLGWLEAIVGPQLPSELRLEGVLKVSGAAVSVCPCAQSPSHEGNRSPLSPVYTAG